MNKDSFIIKFTHIYIINAKKMINAGAEIWEFLIDEIMPYFLKILVDILIVLIRFILCFLPFWQIYETFATKYLTENEFKELTGKNYKSCYVWKKEIKQIEKERRQEQDNRSVEYG